jgi:hypothetical protein
MSRNEVQRITAPGGTGRSRIRTVVDVIARASWPFVKCP